MKKNMLVVGVIVLLLVVALVPCITATIIERNRKVCVTVGTKNNVAEPLGFGTIYGYTRAHKGWKEYIVPFALVKAEGEKVVRRDVSNIFGYFEIEKLLLGETYMVNSSYPGYKCINPTEVPLTEDEPHIRVDLGFEVNHDSKTRAESRIVLRDDPTKEPENDIESACFGSIYGYTDVLCGWCVKPLGGVFVKADGETVVKRDVSNIIGYYEIRGLPVGQTYIVTSRRPGVIPLQPPGEVTLTTDEPHIRFDLVFEINYDSKSRDMSQHANKYLAIPQFRLQLNGQPVFLQSYHK